MRIEWVSDPRAIAELTPAWNALLPRAITNTPFQRMEFLSTWWSALGGGEWSAADLYLAVGYDASDEIQGIAPLFLARSNEERAVLRLLGSVEVADYLDLIVSAQELPGFCTALLDVLSRDPPMTWDVLQLDNLLDSSPSLKVLERGALDAGMQVAIERLQPSPYIPLPASWDGYLDDLAAKQRRELKRKLRRAEAYPSEVRVRFFERGQDLDREVDRFLALMAHDPAKDAFLTPAMRAYFHELARVADDAGFLQLVFLEVGGEAVFGYFNFDYADKLWIYNSGINPAYFGLSPGWVLMGHLVRWAIEQGRHEVDFLRGDELYKYRLGGVERFVMRLTIQREGSTARAASGRE